MMKPISYKVLIPVGLLPLVGEIVGFSIFGWHWWQIPIIVSTLGLSYIFIAGGRGYFPKD